VRGVRKRRIPVQLFEMAWWLAGAILFAALWRYQFPVGSYALAVLAWYGFGRFWLEPLREHVDVVLGGLRINQLVAALLALGAGGALLVRGLS
jgi:prolipoprotein diacylglyceryltransferase